MKDSKKANEYYLIGNKYFSDKDYAKAILNWEKVIEFDKDVFSVYNNLGIGYKLLKDYDKAIWYYKKGIEFDKNDKNVYFNLGIVYQNLKEYDNAILNYKKAIELDKNFTGSYNNLGVIYKLLNDKDKAILNYNKAIESNKNFTSAYVNLGNILHDLYNYDKAILNYKKAIELDKNHAEAYYNLGLVYHDLKDFDKAILNYKKAIELNKNFAHAYYNLGLVYQNLKDSEKAILNYKKAIELENHLLSLVSISLLYFNINEKKKSSQYLKMAKKHLIKNRDDHNITKGNLAYINSSINKLNLYFIDKLESFQKKIESFDKKKEGIKKELTKLLQTNINHKLEKIQKANKIENEKELFDEEENYVNIKISEIDEFLSKKDINKSVEKYKKTIYELFIFYFAQLRMFKNDPKGEDNFLFSFIASPHDIANYVFKIYNFFDQKNQIQKQFKLIAKLEDFFSFKKENDISKLVYFIINDKLIREKIINCEKNEEVKSFKKKGFFKKVKLFFKKDYIDTFDDNEQILAYIDFEFIKYYLLEEIFPGNWDYEEKIKSIYKKLKQTKYEKKTNIEIKNKINKNIDNIEGIIIKNISITLFKQYSTFSKHDVNFIISQNGKMLYNELFKKQSKNFSIDFQNSEIVLEKKILEIKLIIKGNNKSHFRKGLNDLKYYKNEKEIKLEILKETSSKPSGFIKLELY